MRRVPGFDFVLSGSVMSFDSSVADVGMLQEDLYYRAGTHKIEVSNNIILRHEPIS